MDDSRDPVIDAEQIKHYQEKVAGREAKKLKNITSLAGDIKTIKHSNATDCTFDDSTEGKATLLIIADAIVPVVNDIFESELTLSVEVKTDFNQKAFKLEDKKRHLFEVKLDIDVEDVIYENYETIERE